MYYYLPESGITQWEMPENPATALPPPPPTPSAPTLPPEETYSAHVSQEGRTFYVNAASGRSQWETPDPMRRRSSIQLAPFTQEALRQETVLLERDHPVVLEFAQSMTPFKPQPQQRASTVTTTPYQGSEGQQMQQMQRPSNVRHSVVAVATPPLTLRRTSITPAARGSVVRQSSAYRPPASVRRLSQKYPVPAPAPAPASAQVPVPEPVPTVASDEVDVNTLGLSAGQLQLIYDTLSAPSLQSPSLLARAHATNMALTPYTVYRYYAANNWMHLWKVRMHTHTHTHIHTHTPHRFAVSFPWLQHHASHHSPRLCFLYPTGQAHPSRHRNDRSVAAAERHPRAAARALRPPHPQRTELYGTSPRQARPCGNVPQGESGCHSGCRPVRQAVKAEALAAGRPSPTPFRIVPSSLTSYALLFCPVYRNPPTYPPIPPGKPHGQKGARLCLHPAAAVHPGARGSPSCGPECGCPG